LAAGEFTGGDATVGAALRRVGLLVQERLPRLGWRWDELVLACDLVHANGWDELRPPDPPVVGLSALLQRLPIYPVDLRAANFRSPDAVWRKTTDLATAHPDD
jgi:5-methylcytosine-specific restriction protein A